MAIKRGSKCELNYPQQLPTTNLVLYPEQHSTCFTLINLICFPVPGRRTHISKIQSLQYSRSYPRCPLLMNTKPAVSWQERNIFNFQWYQHNMREIAGGEFQLGFRADILYHMTAHWGRRQHHQYILSTTGNKMSDIQRKNILDVNATAKSSY